MLYDLYGISIDKTVLNALKYTSPIGGLFYIGLQKMHHLQFLILMAFYMAWYLCTSHCRNICVDIFSYKRRKAEDVSKPFVYNLLYYIIISLITFDILAFVKEEKDFLCRF